MALFLLKLLPIIFSAFTFFVSVNKISRHGDRLIWAAFLMLLFSIMTAWLSVLSPALEVNVFDLPAAFILPIVAFLAWLIIKASRMRAFIYVNGPVNKSQIVVYCWSLSSFAIMVIIAMAVPAFAWDSLDHWMPEAARLVKVVIEGTEKDFTVKYIHPSTGVGILAWFSGHPSVSTGGSLGFLVGLLPIFIVALSCAGILSNLNVKGLPVLVGVAMVLTMPLGSNHLIGYGYVDMWTAASVVLALAAVMTFIEHPSAFRFVFSAICVALIAVWRNNAVVYIAPLGLTVVSWGFFHSSKSGKILFIGAIFLSLFWAKAFMTPFLNLQAFGLGNFGIDYRGSGIRLWIGYRVLDLAVQNPAAVSDALFQALFVNKSFSTIAILWSLAAAWTISGRDKVSSGAVISVIYSGYLILTFLVALLLSPFFLYSYSVPSSDTGLSRFMLTWAYSAVPIISYAFAKSLGTPHLDVANQPLSENEDAVKPRGFAAAKQL